MTTEFLNDGALKGPYGTRRQPQVWDLIPHVRLQEKPLVNLPEDPLRWYTSPYLWQLQQAGDQNAAVIEHMADNAAVEQMIRQQARQFNVQADLLRQMLEQQGVLNRQLIGQLAPGKGKGKGRGLLAGVWNALGGAQGPPGPQGPQGPQGPPGAAINEQAIVDALRPLFENQGQRLMQILQQGLVVPPAVNVNVDGQAVAQALAPLFGQQSQTILEAMHATAAAAHAAQTAANTAASVVATHPAIQDVTPADPPVQQIPQPQLEALLALPPYMNQAAQSMRQLEESNRHVIEMLKQKAIEDNVGAAMASAAEQQNLRAIADQMIGAVTSTFDVAMQKLSAFALAQQVAPNPHFEALQDRFIQGMRRVEEIQQQLGAMQASFQSTTTGAMLAISDELKKAEAERAQLAVAMQQQVELYTQGSGSLAEKILQQQAQNQQVMYLVEGVRAAMAESLSAINTQMGAQSSMLNAMEAKLALPAVPAMQGLPALTNLAPTDEDVVMFDAYFPEEPRLALPAPASAASGPVSYGPQSPLPQAQAPQMTQEQLTRAIFNSAVKRVIKEHMYEATQLQFAKLLQDHGKEVVDILFNAVTQGIPDFPDQYLASDGFLDRQKSIVMGSLGAANRSPDQIKRVLMNLAALIRASELARQAQQRS